MNVIRIWREFLDTLNTPGGHIVILCFLVILGAVANRNGYAKADDIIVGAFAALLAGLRPGQSIQPPKPPTS